MINIYLETRFSFNNISLPSALMWMNTTYGSCSHWFYENTLKSYICVRCFSISLSLSLSFIFSLCPLLNTKLIACNFKVYKHLQCFLCCSIYLVFRSNFVYFVELILYIRFRLIEYLILNMWFQCRHNTFTHHLYRYSPNWICNVYTC